MNRDQRNKNRANAERLTEIARSALLMRHICENCGEPGGHWVQVRGNSIQAMVTGVDDQEGFWTCPKLYGTDGRRLPEHTERNWSEPADALGIAALIFSGVLADA